MPTKAELVYLSPAAADFEEIVKKHMVRSGVKYAREISASMENQIDRLRAYPLMGQTHPDPILAAQGFRKLVLGKTYVAIYKLIDNTVYIYGIVDGRTDYPKLFY